MATKEAISTLMKMRASAANKTEKDMEQVSLGYGFEVWEGKKHTTAAHPKYKHLITQWPRHGDILPVYVRKLIKLVDELERLEGELKNV